jgi:tRNA (Thr-GGU) A37 N-methylase
MNAAHDADVVCRHVGIVHSRFTEASGMPIQAAGAPEEGASRDVFAEFAPGLRDIDGTSAATT